MKMMTKATILTSSVLLIVGLMASSLPAPPASKKEVRVYHNKLKLIQDPKPLLADHPDFVQPVEDVRRYEAPRLVDDAGANLSVRGWRFSYNARGIIEVPNRMKAAKTAIVVVHPWGVDDGQGWITPQPAGAAFACTPEKNKLMLKHGKKVINPFLQKMRSKVGMILYSLPGKGDPIRRKLYRSMIRTPSAAERQEGKKLLAAKLSSFRYRGANIPQRIQLSSGKPVVDYFRQFRGLDATAKYNNKGYWDLPIPVMKTIEVAPNDVVVYDGEGYNAMKRFLQKNGIEHVLICGYHADMCVCSTTAGYENLRRDFNTFLVGDAVQATLPANSSSRYATNQAVSYAALDVFITQTSWVKLDAKPKVTARN